MCDICDRVKELSRPIHPTKTEEILDLIGARVVERPNTYRHLTKVVDDLLGTGLSPRNGRAEEVFRAKQMSEDDFIEAPPDEEE